MDPDRKRFSRLTAAALRPLVITGAGVSAESGVPTFRGVDGLWRSHRAETLATPGAFAADPGLVWEWYDWRRSRVATARPNPAHRWITGYLAERPSGLLVTQNVDGLHRLSGLPDPVEIHGSLWTVRCTVCGAEAEDRRIPLPIPPRCAGCGGLLRPGVVWFGEPLPAAALERAVTAAAVADLVLVVGTSAVVYPVAGLPALARDAPLVEINPEPTPLSPAAMFAVRARAGEFLAPLC
ncbi:MAG TPA: NAD-dependent deacylase [Deferrisomatales bacterium]|nr:NAD-dependent deacylase [Deferrisomatales bacterium]